MATIRQIEANRRNAVKSTGPKTENGKQRSSQNAVRHGLTSETVISRFEDEEDYQAFELAVTAEYGGDSAVERELVLRLASLLWRLRRATLIETNLFEIEASNARVLDSNDDTDGGPSLIQSDCHEIYRPSEIDPRLHLALCFMGLTKLENGIFERLGRYEAALWRQVRQALFTLDSYRTPHAAKRIRHRPYPWESER